MDFERAFYSKCDDLSLMTTERDDLRSKLAAAEADIARVKECHEETAEKLHTYIKLHAAAEAELTAANTQMRELGRQLAEAGEARIAAEARVGRLQEALETGVYAIHNFVNSPAPDSESLQVWAEMLFLPQARAALTASPSDYRERVRREAFEEAAKVCEEGDFDSEMKIYGRAFAELIRTLGDSNANG